MISDFFPGDLQASSILPDEADAVSVESVVMVEQAADEATVASNELAVAAGTEAEVNAVGAQEEEPTVAAVAAEAATLITAEPVTEFSVSEASTSVPAAEGDEVIINLSATLLPESPAAATAAAAAAVMETMTPVNVLSTDAVASVIPAADFTDIISEATAETNEATQATDSKATSFRPPELDKCLE